MPCFTLATESGSTIFNYRTVIIITLTARHFDCQASLYPIDARFLASMPQRAIIFLNKIKDGKIVWSHF